MQLSDLQMDHRQELAKAERMELLYQRSGRAAKDHPQHGLFTGLLAEFRQSSQQEP